MASISEPDRDMAERGRQRRLSLGRDTKTVAQAMGITTNRLQQLETDGALGLHIIRRWAAALDMDPQDLAFGPPDPGPYNRGLVRNPLDTKKPGTKKAKEKRS